MGNGKGPGAFVSTPARELAAKIAKNAREGGRLVRSREAIGELALRDEITVSSRGTADVLTKYRNPAFVSRVTSRSAAFTEIFFGEQSERQKKADRGGGGVSLGLGRRAPRHGQADGSPSGAQPPLPHDRHEAVRPAPRDVGQAHLQPPRGSAKRRSRIRCSS